MGGINSNRPMEANGAVFVFCMQIKLFEKNDNAIPGFHMKFILRYNTKKLLATQHDHIYGQLSATS